MDENKLLASQYPYPFQQHTDINASKEETRFNQHCYPAAELCPTQWLKHARQITGSIIKPEEKTRQE
jgi:hypothetical protein